MLPPAANVGRHTTGVGFYVLVARFDTIVHYFLIGLQVTTRVALYFVQKPAKLRCLFAK